MITFESAINHTIVVIELVTTVDKILIIKKLRLNTPKIVNIPLKAQKNRKIR